MTPERVFSLYADSATLASRVYAEGPESAERSKGVVPTRPEALHRLICTRKVHIHSQFTV